MAYIFLDGDSVGPTLENLLRADRTPEATALSSKLRDVVSNLEQVLLARSGAELVLFGGDDFLVHCDHTVDPFRLATQIRQFFSNATGLTMSAGIGKTVTEAIDNLALAKSSGKNQTRGRAK